MKKRILVCAALAICCGVVFAQGAPLVTLTGQLQTGVQDVVALGAGTVSDAVSLYDIESGSPSRFRVGVLFASPDGTWGISTRLDGENLAVGGLTATWNRAFVWGDLFDRLVTVKAGLLGEESFSFTWRSWGAENIWGDQFDGNLGAELQVRPLPGLLVAYVYPILNGTKALDSLESGYVAAAFEAQGIGRLVAGAQLSNAINSTSAWVGMDLTLLANFTARAAAQAFYVGDAQYSWIQVYEEAGYQLGDAGLSLKAWEEAYAAPGSALGFRIEPAAAYSFGTLTLGVVVDGGNLMAVDPNPGVAALPLGWAAGAFCAYALAPAAIIKAGCRYLVPDVSETAASLQVFASFAWSF
jgi:hypothetical protein